MPKSPPCPRCEGATSLRSRKTDGRTFWGCDATDCRGALWQHDEDTAQEIADAREILENPLVSDSPIATKLLTLLDAHPARVLPLVLGRKTPGGAKTVEAILGERAREDAPRKTTKKRVKKKKKKRTATLDPLRHLHLYGPEDALEGPALSMVKIPEGDTCQVSSHLYPHHKLKHSALNPVQSRVFEVYEKDCNVVIAASTSAGKTLSAEILMGDAIDRNGKVIFLSPLRSVSQEKFDEWGSSDHPWREFGVEIITGDYSLTEAKKKALLKANVIVMTSEMLDSKTRRMGKDENIWLQQTMCLVGSSQISLADGTTKTIQEIVEKKLEVEVLAFDHVLDRVVKRRVIGWHKNPLGDRELTEVVCETAKLTCTEDHEVYQRGVGYSAARTLTSSSVVEVLDGGSEGSSVRCKERDCPDRNREVGSDRDVAGGQFDFVGIRGSCFCASASQELPRTKGSRVLEIRDIEATRANTAKGNAESWIQEGRGGGRVLHPVLRRGAKEDQRGALPGEDIYKGSSRRVDAPRGTSGLVHGRRVKTEGCEPGASHTGNGSEDHSRCDRLAVGGVGYRGHPNEGQESEIRCLEAASGIRGEIHGSRAPSCGRGHVYGAQDSFRARDTLLSDVRSQVRGDTEAATHEEEICDLSFGELQEGPRLDDREDQRRQGEAFVYDLTVDGDHNYFAEGILVHNCLVVDEAHLLCMKDRGDALEAGLMRFTRHNPRARIVLLSATMPNVDELGGWLTRLNGKPSRVIQSDWRPTTLDVNYVPYAAVGGWGSYQKNENAKMHAAIDLVQRYPDDKWIVFVHSKKAGNKLLGELKERRESVEFHSADLNRDLRLKLERNFRDGDLRVVIATSTLAYGINMPARRVCVMGVHRGMEKVDPIDVKQMVGRAGRVGLDPRGDAYVLLPDENGRSSKFERLCEEFSEIGLIKSQINTVDTLAFHLCAEVAEGDVSTEAGAIEWHERSLAHHQGLELDAEGKTVSAARVMGDLAKCGILSHDEETNEYEATALGRVSSWLYYSPFDISDWATNFRWISERDKHRDDDCIAWALGKVKTAYYGTWLPKEHNGDMGDLEHRLRNKGIDKLNLPPACLAFSGMLRGVEFRGMASHQRQLSFDAERIAQAVSMIDQYVLKGLGSGYCDLLTMRLKYGCTWTEADLCRLPGVGKARAKKLIREGVTSIRACLDDKESVVRACGQKIAVGVVRGAKEILRKGA